MAAILNASSELTTDFNEYFGYIDYNVAFCILVTREIRIIPTPCCRTEPKDSTHPDTRARIRVRARVRVRVTFSLILRSYTLSNLYIYCIELQALQPK